MSFIVLTLAIAVALGSVLGGRLANLASLRLRWAGLAVVAFAMQLIDPPGRWPLAMLLGSFVALVVFAVANREVPGFRVILAGIAMNAAVIVANGGMPVSAAALEASGQQHTVEALTDHADASVKHHLAGPDDTLLILADVIALPAPIAQAISLGDIVTYGGVAMVLVLGMRRPRVDPRTAAPIAAQEVGHGHG
jgi:hypothetical protein